LHPYQTRDLCLLGVTPQSKFFRLMAGTTGLEPATSAVTGQRSDQLSYVPTSLFRHLDLCHIESGVSQKSLFSLDSTFSPLWTRFWGFCRHQTDTKKTPKPPRQRQDKVYQMNGSFGVRLPSHRHKKWSLLADQGSRSPLTPLPMATQSLTSARPAV
jgi:hypothetical protein